MRFRVQNIRPGYCEIWANERTGQRYRKIAIVKQLDNKGWHWLATDYYILPEENYVAQSTRRHCIKDCKRTALMRLAEHAIDRQPKESPHWHSPRRDAWGTVTASHLFTQVELGAIKERLESFEESE